MYETFYTMITCEAYVMFLKDILILRQKEHVRAKHYYL